MNLVERLDAGALEVLAGCTCDRYGGCLMCRTADLMLLAARFIEAERILRQADEELREQEPKG